MDHNHYVLWSDWGSDTFLIKMLGGKSLFCCKIKTALTDNSYSLPLNQQEPVRYRNVLLKTYAAMTHRSACILPRVSPVLRNQSKTLLKLINSLEHPDDYRLYFSYLVQKTLRVIKSQSWLLCHCTCFQGICLSKDVITAQKQKVLLSYLVIISCHDMRPVIGWQSMVVKNKFT